MHNWQFWWLYFMLFKMLPIQNLDTNHKSSETRVKLNCYLLHSTHGKCTYVINMPSTVFLFTLFKSQIILFLLNTVFKISKYLFFAVYMYPRMLPAPTWIKMVLIKMLLWYYYATIRNQCHTVGKHFPPHTLNGQFRINFIILYKWNQGDIS